MPDQPDITIPVDGTAGPAAAEPGPPGGERFLCVISTCSWHLEVPPAPIVDPMLLADVFGPGAMALQALNQRQMGIERALEDHLSTHTVSEFALEIASQRDLNISLARQIRELTEAYEIAQANLNYGPVRRTNMFNLSANNPEG